MEPSPKFDFDLLLAEFPNIVATMAVDDASPHALYRWNEQCKTMESSVYGHPAKPKNGPYVARLLGNWETRNFGLTLENQGLRALFELTGPDAEQAKQNR